MQRQLVLVPRDRLAGAGARDRPRSGRTRGTAGRRASAPRGSARHSRATTPRAVHVAQQVEPCHVVVVVMRGRSPLRRARRRVASSGSIDSSAGGGRCGPPEGIPSTGRSPSRSAASHPSPTAVRTRSRRLVRLRSRCGDSSSQGCRASRRGSSGAASTRRSSISSPRLRAVSASALAGILDRLAVRGEQDVRRRGARASPQREDRLRPGPRPRVRPLRRGERPDRPAPYSRSPLKARRRSSELDEVGDRADRVAGRRQRETLDAAVGAVRYSSTTPAISTGSSSEKRCWRRS